MWKMMQKEKKQLCVLEQELSEFKCSSHRTSSHNCVTHNQAYRRQLSSVSTIGFLDNKQIKKKIRRVYTQWDFQIIFFCAHYSANETGYRSQPMSLSMGYQSPYLNDELVTSFSFFLCLFEDFDSYSCCVITPLEGLPGAFDALCLEKLVLRRVN